jgi:hypothetical protein
VQERDLKATKKKAPLSRLCKKSTGLLSSRQKSRQKIPDSGAALRPQREIRPPGIEPESKGDRRQVLGNLSFYH